MFNFYILFLLFLPCITSHIYICSPTNGNIQLNSKLNFKVNYPFIANTTIPTLNCTSSTLFTSPTFTSITILTNSYGKCPLTLNQIESKIIIQLNNLSNYGNGILTIKDYDFNFKGKIKEGEQNGNIINIQSKIINDKNELFNNCLHGGLFKFKLKVNNVLF
ncbi:hypothetical protein K502DRAFT_345351 [Neoconidiobolus thromboides FSU 785]|nr:hypothetical protein K502DRAFT_345351 [Neoconidiobolus thromboides FSU 785]